MRQNHKKWYLHNFTLQNYNFLTAEVKKIWYFNKNLTRRVSSQHSPKAQPLMRL